GVNSRAGLDARGRGFSGVVLGNKAPIAGRRLRAVDHYYKGKHDAEANLKVPIHRFLLRSRVSLSWQSLPLTTLGLSPEHLKNDPIASEPPLPPPRCRWDGLANF